MITLIGESLAKEGTSFIFNGPAEECESCRFNSSCINSLEKGHKYKIIEVRDSQQKCPLHYGEKVNVVIVEEGESIIFTDSKVFEGSKFTFENLKCDNEDCDFRDYCFPDAIKSGDKCIYIEDFGKINDCPKELSLRKVSVKLQD